jgi:hypothetical protein
LVAALRGWSKLPAWRNYLDKPAISRFPSTALYRLPVPARVLATIAATFAFPLAEIPNPATLETLVTGIASACPLPRQPQGSTELIVNGQQVKSFTLGPSGIGHTYRVMAALEQSMLKRGDNTLVLKGAPCTLGNFEVVKISDVIVRSVR